MPDSVRLRVLGRRLAGAFLLTAAAPIAVIFLGSLAAHLTTEPDPPHDVVDDGWLVAAVVAAALTAVLSSIVAAHRIVRPVNAVIATAHAFAAGDRTARPVVGGRREFEDLAAAFGQAADEVQRSETARRQLTADIAHELRTPLAALSAGLEELKDGLVDPQPGIIAALHSQALRMGRVLEDLAALAAAESDTLRLDPQTIDLAAVVRPVLTDWHRTMRDAGLTVAFEGSRGVVVLADADRVQQMVGNLLANAARYCRSGDSVQLRVRRSGEYGRIEVTDTGPGFAPEELAVVFDRAWRSPAAQGTPGSGLGLPIVRALAVAQGGRAGVASPPGGGAQFVIELPLATAPAARGGPAPRAEAGAGAMTV